MTHGSGNFFWGGKTSTISTPAHLHERIYSETWLKTFIWFFFTSFVTDYLISSELDCCFFLSFTVCFFVSRRVFVASEGTQRCNCRLQLVIGCVNNSHKLTCYTFRKSFWERIPSNSDEKLSKIYSLNVRCGQIKTFRLTRLFEIRKK